MSTMAAFLVGTLMYLKILNLSLKLFLEDLAPCYHPLPRVGGDVKQCASVYTGEDSLDQGVPNIQLTVQKAIAWSRGKISPTTMLFL